jgi:Domain of Unknown Function with PDB structure (DUF3857)
MKSLFTSILVLSFTFQMGYAQLKVKEHTWQATTPTINIPDSLNDNDAIMVHLQHDIKNNLDITAGKAYYIISKRLRIKINTQNGLEDYSEFIIFKNKRSKVTKLDARTIKKDGKIIDLSINDIKILGINIDANKKGFENLRFSIPGVEIGDEVEVIYTLESEGLMTGSDIQLYTDIPTLKSVFTYTSDNEVFTDFRMYNDLPDPVIKRSVNDAVFTWTLTNLVGLGNQYSSDFTETLPFIRFAVRQVIVNGAAMQGVAKWGILNNDWAEIYDYYVNVFTNVNFDDMYKGSSYTGYIKKFRIKNSGLSTDQKIQYLVNYINDSLEIVETTDETSTKSGMYYLESKVIDEKNIHNLIKNYLEGNKIKYYVVFGRDKTDGRMDIDYASGDMITDVFYATQDSAGNVHFIYPANPYRKFHLDELPNSILGTEAIMVARKYNNAARSDVNKIRIPGYDANVNLRTSMVNIKVNLDAGDVSYKSKSTYRGSFSTRYRNDVLKAMEDEKPNEELIENLELTKNYDVDTFYVDKNENSYPYTFSFSHQGKSIINLQKIDQTTYSIPLVGLVDHFTLFTPEGDRMLTYLCPFRYIDNYKIYLQFDKSIDLLENKFENYWMSTNIGEYKITINKVNDKILLLESKLDLNKERLNSNEFNLLFKTNESINKSSQARILFKTI